MGRSTALAEDLENQVRLLENPNSSSAKPPLYTDVVNKVDDGIRATLFDLLRESPVAISDMEPIKRDIYNKKLVIQSMLPEFYSKNRENYRSAMNAIRNEEWLEAEKNLLKVYIPIELADDARRKLNILREINKSKT